MRVVYAVTLFASAGLYFLAELMTAKELLPRFGGSPAVWTTAVLFFQAVMLAGYAYGHMLGARLGFARQRAIHFAVVGVGVGLLFVPTVDVGAESFGPVTAVLGTLALRVGGPAFVLATSAPLLQRWFTLRRDEGADPYPLYAASNAGSLLALLAYPLAVEPLFGLGEQWVGWAGGFVAFAGLVVVSGVLGRRAEAAPATPVQPPAAPPSTASRLWWVWLAFVPSSLLLGTTTFVSTNIAPLPLLWVGPLALYLLTYVLAFTRMPWWADRVATWLTPLAAVMMVVNPKELGVSGGVATHLIGLFVFALAYHRGLAAARPPAARLTECFFLVSVGGVLGGVFNAVVAPLVFDRPAEYPLVLVAAVAAVPRRFDPDGWVWVRRAGAVVPVAVAGLIALIAVQPSESVGGEVVYRERTFFGTMMVVSSPAEGTYTLIHNGTEHGKQFLVRDPAVRRRPLRYYYPTGPVGQVFATRRVEGRSVRRVGVIGLGVGAMAAYAEPGDEYTFYEIDPAVVRLARGQYFAYLSDAADRGAKVEVVVGDGRLALGERAGERYGVLVVDAFSGDAVPAHLLTREAVDVYLSRLDEGGVIAFHISNRYLNLEPVLAALAADRGLVGRALLETDMHEMEFKKGKLPSRWVVLARSEADLGAVADRLRWQPLPPAAARPWTDSFSNVLSTLK